MSETGDAREALAPQGEGLRHLVKTDADPRVRQRGQALLLVAEGHPPWSRALLKESGQGGGQS